MSKKAAAKGKAQSPTPPAAETEVAAAVVEVDENDPEIIAAKEAAAFEKYKAFAVAAKENCFDYVYNPMRRYCHQAIARITTYARYGPAVEADGVLRVRGPQRPLREHEERLLIQEEVKAFYVDTYCRGAVRSKRDLLKNSQHVHRRANTGRRLLVDDEVYGDVITHRNPLLDSAMEMTRVELEKMLEAWLTAVLAEAKKMNLRQMSDRGMESVVRDSLSTAILKERTRRIAEAKKGTINEVSLRDDTDVSKKAVTRYYNKTTQKPYKLEGWESKNVLRALHRSVWQIAEHENSNKSDICLNVRCLRNDFTYPLGTNKDGWDGYCCLRKPRKPKML